MDNYKIRTRILLLLLYYRNNHPSGFVLCMTIRYIDLKINYVPKNYTSLVINVSNAERRKKELGN